MRAILIDPEARTVEEVEHSGDFRQIYELIQCRTFDAVRLLRHEVVYVDDEGLLNDPRHFFTLRGYSQPLAGRGLVLGVNEEGDSVATGLSVEDVREMVGWAELSVRGFVTTTANGDVMGRPGAIITQTPVFGPPEEK